jgi:hypothetical protein
MAQAPGPGEGDGGVIRLLKTGGFSEKRGLLFRYTQRWQE